MTDPAIPAEVAAPFLIQVLDAAGVAYALHGGRACVRWGDAEITVELGNRALRFTTGLSVTPDERAMNDANRRWHGCVPVCVDPCRRTSWR